MEKLFFLDAADKRLVARRRGVLTLGWAFCTIADDHGQAEVFASDVTGGPEYLLRAVTAIAPGAPTARAEVEGEGVVFRWFFQREGFDTAIRLVQAADRGSPDSEGSVVWSGAACGG
jgi:hypothetical protein